MPTSTPGDYPVLTYVKNVTIASGAALSDSTGDLHSMRPVRLEIPALMAGTVLTFDVSSDDGPTTFNSLHYDNFGTNTEFQIAIGATAAAQSISLAPYLAYFFGVRALKVRAGTVASTSAQATTASIGVVCDYL